MFAMAQQWHLADHVRALVFDTTASNSGWKLVHVFNFKDLVKILLKELMLASRHQIFERILCTLHKELFGDTSGPENTLKIVKILRQFLKIITQNKISRDCISAIRHLNPEEKA